MKVINAKEARIKSSSNVNFTKEHYKNEMINVIMNKIEEAIAIGNVIIQFNYKEFYETFFKGKKCDRFRDYETIDAFYEVKQYFKDLGYIWHWDRAKVEKTKNPYWYYIAW